MSQSGKRAFSHLILETIFPGRCLVCGEWLLGRAPDTIPVCTECRVGLQPEETETRCRVCGTRLISEQDVCRRCRESDFVFDSNIALFPYDGKIKEILQQLKFSNRIRLAPLFAQWVAAALDKAHHGLPLIPVPSRPGRKTPHAVELIARALEKSHGVEVKRVLQRAPGVQQKSLDFSQRKENLKGKIFMARGVAKPCAHGQDGEPAVVVLDDVFTTGATLDACARVLREAGYQRVYGITLVIEE